MPFTIPNKADAPFIQDQSDLDKVDIDILVGASAMTAVMYGRGWLTTGLAVTPSSGLIVNVAAGEARVRGRKVKYAGGTRTLTANASLPRFILITMSDAGVLGTAAGTAATSPKFPTLATNVICLAAVYLPAAATTIVASQITDKRMFAWDPYVENVLWYGALGDGSANDQPGCQLAYDALPDDGGAVVWPDGSYKIQQSPVNTGIGILVQDKAGVRSMGLPGKAFSGAAGGAALQVGTDGMTLFKFIHSSGSTATHSGPTFAFLTFEDTKVNEQLKTQMNGHYNAGTGHVEFTTVQGWSGWAVGDVIRPFNFSQDGWNDDYDTHKITNATWSTAGGGQIVFTSNGHGLVAGQTIISMKNSPTTYDGTFIIVSATANTITVAKTVDPGTWRTEPGQGGLLYRAWVVDAIVSSGIPGNPANDRITAVEPNSPGVDDNTAKGSIAMEIMHNKPTATLLQIAATTRHYTHRCTFNNGKIAVYLDATNSKDVSWGTVDWCTFSKNDVGIKVFGNGGQSLEVVGGDFSLHTGQVGIQGPNPIGTDDINHFRLHGMKVDTSHTSGNGCWFTDLGALSRYSAIGPFNLEMEGDSRGVRMGGTPPNGKGGHATIGPIGAQHNDKKGGVAIELYGGSDTQQLFATILGGEYTNWDTAISVGPYCQSVKVYGGHVTRGNKGIVTDALSELTQAWGFTSSNSDAGYIHIDPHGTGERFTGCDDPDTPGSKHRGEGFGGKVFTAAPASGDGVEGEARFVNLSGTYWIYAKINSIWNRTQLTVSGGGGGGGAAVPIAVFSKQGVLAVGTGTFRQYVNGPWTITKVVASVGTAPVGSAIRVDINNGAGNGASGTTIWTTQANRPSIAAGQFRGNQTTFDDAVLVDDDFLTCDIDVVGSTTPGSDLVVQVFATPG